MSKVQSHSVLCTLCYTLGFYLDLPLLKAFGWVGLDVLPQRAGISVAFGATRNLTGVRLLWTDTAPKRGGAVKGNVKKKRSVFSTSRLAMESCMNTMSTKDTVGLISSRKCLLIIKQVERSHIQMVYRCDAVYSSPVYYSHKHLGKMLWMWLLSVTTALTDTGRTFTLCQQFMSFAP